MSAATTVRVGAALVVTGEVVGFVTQCWAAANTFLAFVALGGALLAAGILVGVRGLLRMGGRPQPIDAGGSPSG